jgi:ribosomal protein S18 acetylase RimI-like enzyme
MNAFAFRIRPATVDDVEAIARVHVAAWQSNYAGLIAPEHIALRSIDDRVRIWTNVLRGETSMPTQVFVGVDDADQAVGFISGGPIRKPYPPFDGELYAIYLHPAAQRHGLGRALVRAWAADLVARGFRCAVVGVLTNNPARQFYERLGARWLHDGSYTIGGHAYPDVWYGWDDIAKLTQP